jgi:hypothetical protein
MLLARLLGWINSHRTFHIFILEVLAVFVGITASLFIDDWRQRQQDRDVLDHLLEATHYSAMQDDSMLRINLGISNVALEDSLWLMYGDVSNASDGELLRRYQNASILPLKTDVQPGYQRLINTSLSIPFDHTMAELDYLFRNVRDASADLNDAHARITVIHRELFAAARLTENDLSLFQLPITGRWVEDSTQLRNILYSHDGFVTEIGNAAAVRSALETAEVRSLLLELVGLRYFFNTTLIQIGNSNDAAIASIRAYDPNVTLPVEVIELIGDATSGNWDGGLPMTRDSRDPNVWRLRAQLTDGQIKFRADNSWSSNWGAPNLPEYWGTGGVFSFGGDASAVFPRGTAEFGGLNIPADAGTYDVTFNTQSFDYSLERVP